MVRSQAHLINRKIRSRMTESPDPSESVSTRIGPRPLGLHLATAALSWTGAVLPGGAWLAASKGTNPLAEIQDLAVAAEQRFTRLIAGIDAYHRHPYRREEPRLPVVWRGTGIRVLDYGLKDRPDAPPLLVIPSLINRHYILDLRPGQSLMRYLAEQGFRPFLVAWEDFDRATRYTTVDDCIAGKLEAALGVIRLLTRRRPVVMGYCLGGLLAAALVSRRPNDVAGLVSLAAPWDFHAGKGGFAPGAAQAAIAVEPVLEALGALPVDWVQTLFYSLDPFQVIDKFLSFAEMAEGSAQAEAFVVLEDWLNDGFPLPAPIARTLLSDWYGKNTPANGDWHISGKPVCLDTIRTPALVVVPATDRIVPPPSARAMAAAIPGASMLEVPNGHIGMVASRNARSQVWEPLTAWLQEAAG